MTLFSVLNSNQSNIFLYCVKTNRITVKAWFELTIRGVVHTIFFRIQWLKFPHLDVLKAKLLVFKLDSEEEEFLGFDVECRLQRGVVESESDM